MESQSSDHCQAPLAAYSSSGSGSNDGWNDGIIHSHNSHGCIDEEPEEEFSEPLSRQTGNNNGNDSFNTEHTDDSDDTDTAPTAAVTPSFSAALKGNIDGDEPAAPKYTNSILEIVVGPKPPSPLFNYTQRTFYLPKSLLSKHSTFFRDIIDKDVDRIALPNGDPRMFQNFVDFLHSNIYSLNTAVNNYNPVSHHASAWIVGQLFGCPSFRNAALCKLHTLFEPHASMQGSHATVSPIRPAHIQFVCVNTEKDSALRLLFFDAVAAHWTQFEAMNIGNHMDVDGESVSWLQVYNQFHDFRNTLAFSSGYVDNLRGRLLGDVEEYLMGDGLVKLVPVEHQAQPQTQTQVQRQVHGQRVDVTENAGDDNGSLGVKADVGDWIKDVRESLNEKEYEGEDEESSEGRNEVIGGEAKYEDDELLYMGRSWNEEKKDFKLFEESEQDRKIDSENDSEGKAMPAAGVQEKNEAEYEEQGRKKKRAKLRKPRKRHGVKEPLQSGGWEADDEREDRKG